MNIFPLTPFTPADRRAPYPAYSGLARIVFPFTLEYHGQRRLTSALSRRLLRLAEHSSNGGALLEHPVPPPDFQALLALPDSEVEQEIAARPELRLADPNAQVSWVSVARLVLFFARLLLNVPILPFLSMFGHSSE